MGSSAGGGGQAFDADAAVDGTGEQEQYRPDMHAQLRAVAEHAALSVELAESQIASLQEAMQARREHAQEAAAELQAYEDRYDVHQSNRSTTPQE
jgi:hypothetical protein